MTAGFTGRRIIITGAARGIGKACALRFAGAGATVGCLDIDHEALKQLEQESGNDGIHARHADVTSPSSLKDAIDGLAHILGGIDGVVNAAGIDLVRPIEEMSDTDWNRVISINLTGPMNVCREAFPYLKQGGGTIVNVSSGAGLQPLKYRSAYSASKAGLQMFSKALAMEAADFGIRVNTVCPGAVETELFRSSLDGVPDPEMARGAIQSRYALGRIAEPDEIAAAVFWLSSSESSYVTGAAIAVDGGRTFH